MKVLKSPSWLDKEFVYVYFYSIDKLYLVKSVNTNAMATRLDLIAKFE